MQNSGIGNAINPLCSLTNEAVYAVPTFLVVGWRGEPGVKDEPQHVFQGLISPDLLECVGVRTMVLDAGTTGEELRSFLAAARGRFGDGKASAVLVRKGALSRVAPYSYQRHERRALTRERAVEIVTEALPAGAAVVSTTGKLSRELFEIRERRGEGHEADFLTVGSMGHSSMIGLGIALAQPWRRVVVLDGDGAVIMHAGALAIVGQRSPGRYVHVLINNAAHETVGGMPTASQGIDYQSLARSAGYRATYAAESEAEVQSALRRLLDSEGPGFLEVRTSATSRADLGRPTTTALENRDVFREFLRRHNVG
jgi:phosphonopyruvate decarboxylase